MKNTKTVSIALALIFICFSFSSCFGRSRGEGEKAGSTSAVRFEEIPRGERLFGGMTEDNFFDVTDFSISKVNGNGDLNDLTPVVGFSYVPPALRHYVDIANAFSHNSDLFSMFVIDAQSAVECLESLRNIRPIRLLKPDSTQREAVLSSFSEQYGIAYSLNFIHNEKRNSADVSLVQQQTFYDFLISPLTENNTYYLCDKNTLTVAEVEGARLPFLGKPPQAWYYRSFFEKHIALVDRIEISIKNGTTAGVRGVKDVTLEQYHTDPNGALIPPLDVVSGKTKGDLHATARYNGGSKSITDIPKYRKFYGVILMSKVGEIVFDQNRQEQLKNAAPEMVLKIHVQYDGYEEQLEYRFFEDGSVLFNGVYVGRLIDGHLDRLIRSTGLMLSSDAADTINLQ